MTGNRLFLRCFLGRLLGLLLLQDSLDDLLFLNQKGSDNSLLDTVGTSRPTVSSRHGLVGLGDLSVLSGSQSGDTSQGVTTVTTLGSGGSLLDVLSDQLSTRGLNDLDLIRSGVVYDS
jgi:hypothetical protein